MQKINKQYLEQQIRDCEEAVRDHQKEADRNQGAADLCRWMLQNLEILEIEEPKCSQEISSKDS